MSVFNQVPVDDTTQRHTCTVKVLETRIAVPNWSTAEVVSKCAGRHGNTDPTPGSNRGRCPTFCNGDTIPELPAAHAHRPADDQFDQMFSTTAFHEFT